MDLEGWSDPWLMDLAFLCARLTGCRLDLDRPRRVLLRGVGAGVAANRAEDVRRRIDAHVERLGGDAALAALPCPRPGLFTGSIAATGPWGRLVFAPAAPVAGRLADTVGAAAAQVYRMLAVRRLLEQETVRMVEETRAAARRAERRTDPEPADPEPARPADPEEPPPVAPIAPPTEDELTEAEEQRRWANRVLGDLDEVRRLSRVVVQRRPPWLGEPVDPPTSTAMTRWVPTRRQDADAG